MSETQNKIQRVQKFLTERGLEAVRLKGVDWFSWITCGGSSVVIFTAEAGIAEVLVTQNKAWVIANNIERDRLAAEELPRDFELVSFPWEESGAADEFVKSKSSRCISDRPVAGEKPLPPEFLHLRLILTNEEVSRYRLLGRAAAEAMTQAISKAEPEWSERKLAGEGAQALWSRGLDPTLILVGSERRVTRFRHPVSTNERLGDYAMMVFCARAFGLYANLTRFIFFRQPSAAERDAFEDVAGIEARAFSSSRPGTRLSAVYQDIRLAYVEAGIPDEIDRHHQGGLTGFLSRKIVATPHLKNDVILQNSMALAWNPSLPGAKIKDTVLINEEDCEILTVDPLWPTFEMEGRLRPRVWV